MLFDVISRCQANSPTLFLPLFIVVGLRALIPVLVPVAVVSMLLACCRYVVVMRESILVKSVLQYVAVMGLPARRLVPPASLCFHFWELHFPEDATLWNVLQGG